MSQEVILSGLNGVRLSNELSRAIRSEGPLAIGIASGFVSVVGVEIFEKIVKRQQVRECRLVAGIDMMITPPQALENASDYGWKVRIGKSPLGIFHPKLVVGGKRFGVYGRIVEPSFCYLGSGNLTKPGLTQNVECGVCMRGKGGIEGLSETFSNIWQNAHKLTKTFLSRYSKEFASHSRSQKPKEFSKVGLTDTTDVSDVSTQQLRNRQPPKHGAFNRVFANAAWAGLESFTGEYRFQLEFPRDAGEVVRILIGDRYTGQNDVIVKCTDGQKKAMRYQYYHHNSMFRLNIQNDVPGVAWARQNRQGIAVVQRLARGSTPISLRILQPGWEVDEIIQRSFVLGTWGKTSTRAYGWF
ncbi:MAG: hypothetical protein JRH09_15470 [Deltaproteobacteria bacterium]|nr:hypothetical protein [Deltaproteobacteria bacterium]